MSLFIYWLIYNLFIFIVIAQKNHKIIHELRIPQSAEHYLPTLMDIKPAVQLADIPPLKPDTLGLHPVARIIR